jgi:membrane protease YdiL (CAAX protease family)
MQTELTTIDSRAAWRKRIGFLDVVIAFVLYLVLQILGVILVLVLGNVEPSSVEETLLIVAVVALSTLLSVGLTVAFRWRLSFSSIGLRSVSWRWLLAGTGIGLLGWAANVGISFAYVWLTGDASNPQEPLVNAAQESTIQFTLMLMLGALAVPLAEELLFRGILYTWLRRWGVAVAVGVSAIVFGLFHGVSIVLPAAMLLGVVTALIYEKSGSIWPAVMVHVVNNTIVFAIARVLTAMGTEVS